MRNEPNFPRLGEKIHAGIKKQLATKHVQHVMKKPRLQSRGDMQAIEAARFAV